MGLFDAAKRFTGGKNLAAVQITTIERNDPAEAFFPLNDSVLKGKMLVTAKEGCEVLATKYELFVRNGKNEQSVAKGFDPEPNTSYSDDYPKFPVKLAAGESFDMGFIVSNVDVRRALAQAGMINSDKAIGNPDVQFIVRCIADVKGSPFDPSAEVAVRLTPANI